MQRKGSSMIEHAKIYSAVRDFLRDGPASAYHTDEWLPTNRLAAHEWRDIAQVLYDRDDIDADAWIAILAEAAGQETVNAWLTAFAADVIRPGRGEYPGITKEQTAKALVLAFERNVVPGETVEDKWRWVIYRLNDAIPDVDRTKALVRYAIQRIREVVDEDVERPPRPAEPEPEPLPEDLPAPEPLPQDVFRYEPRGDQLFIRVPAYMRVWKMNVFGRRRHAHLVEDVPGPGPYTIQMSGERLRQMAIESGEPDGSVMVYVNTGIHATGNNKSAGWRIMDPRVAVVGDATRLRAGENQ